jgi:hypothetical protein
VKKLAPDFKTIADFRKDNVDCIKSVFKEFVYLCRKPDLYGAQLIAIDGTKFRAVNSRSNNLNEKTVALRLKKTGSANKEEDVLPLVEPLSSPRMEWSRRKT